MEWVSKCDRNLFVKLISYLHPKWSHFQCFSYCTPPTPKISYEVCISLLDSSDAYRACPISPPISNTFQAFYYTQKNVNTQKLQKMRKSTSPVPCHCDLQKNSALILNGLMLNGWSLLTKSIFMEDLLALKIWASLLNKNQLLMLLTSSYVKK